QGRLRGQSAGGACRSKGLVAGEHVPDRFGELAGDVDLGDLGAALLAESLLVALVAVVVGRVAAGVDSCFHKRPAQVFRACVGQVTAAVGGARLVHLGA